MFTKKDAFLFLVSAILVTGGYISMLLDNVPSGFGILTLTIAPILLLMGFALPVTGIIGSEHFNPTRIIEHIRTDWQKPVAGFSVFIIAITTYISTLEPTASLWDCGEFIASAYKLEVPHTPGTPLTLLFGRLFTMLAFGDVQKVAWCMNLMSAFFSAASVLIVFHLIFIFSQNIRRASGANPNITLSILAAICGSLCLTFSDSFWFSAVEAETYGIACFFLLLILFLIVKGNAKSEPLRSRYLVLISYLTALSYCIHPMCVLVLPVLPFLWFVKNRTVSLKILIVSVSVGLLIVFSINKFVAIGLFELAFNFDLFFVNNLALPFYSGAIVLVTTITSGFYFLINKFNKYRAYSWSVAFLLLGFLPYLMLFIRSNQNPPIDETNPEDLAMIKAYMNRESYPSSPLLTGPYFDARITDVVNSRTAYYKSDSEYKVAGNLINYVYEKNRTTILPRMYSRDANHIKAYRQWTGLTSNEKPTFKDNLYFMFRYQLGHMYLRYLLWNFVGRESDVQDSAWLKPWDSLAKEKDSKSRNQYWMIPLLLGLCGAVIQYHADKKNFFVNAVFFLITGLVLAVYLNSPPIEPRERDYIYVASYIAFSIWVGIGVLSLHNRFLPERVQLYLIALLSIALPGWMLYQNYDDHDRSGRTFQVDYARAALNSCPKDAVLFTGGDNDTFPLWYLQEVEGVRTDVRVMVLSYFNTDWYINELRKTYYNSPPLKLFLDQNDYRQYGPNDVLYLDDKIKEGIDAKQYLTLLKQKHKALQVQTSTGDSYNIIPSRILKLSVPGNDSTREMKLRVEGNYLEKNALAIVDLILNNDWKRPLCFNYTSENSLSLNLKPYLQQIGQVYQLMSVPNKDAEISIDKDRTYQNLVENTDYSNLLNPKVNFNYEDYFLRMIVPVRLSFNILADAYLQDGNKEMAEKVLNAAVSKLYPSHLPPSYTNVQAADMFARLGKKEQATLLTVPTFNYYYDQVQSEIASDNDASDFNVFILRQSANLLAGLGETTYLNKMQNLGL